MHLGRNSAATGVFFIDFVFESFGILLGATGYGFGTRRLGKATVVISTVLLLVSLAASQGEIPGIDLRARGPSRTRRLPNNLAANLCGKRLSPAPDAGPQKRRPP